ncbi:uncharacterized protein F5891DRAFT_761761 [Suillus fuscotomentosus]|uniref:Uncharacterized protein n=1 Tax=Suillus fuscotomentosus TaxID=1912939 RepID=A0AAD4EF30_9AGAM|nr:uncharacterized protein F5891DRAFT_761761 [Suillus fuscotomentosus]KAG1904876.1 hypothetical protein F5891DRAFT_761761 [Suillus fuscotomentosus]
MPAMTMSAVHPVLRASSPMPYASSPLAASSPMPYVSSPLAASSLNAPSGSSRASPMRPSFPHSRPLRPFVSISQNTSSRSSKKPVKFIEPPKNSKTVFVLDLTQGELSRQD